jgi:uncharacterized membrane-anchored protein
MRTWILRIILVLQILGLGGLYAYHLNIEKTGKTYLLKVWPVDPRDLLSGDYVSLRYDISTPPDRFDELKLDDNQDVYVVLQPAGPVWEIKDVTKVQPQSNLPYLEGRVLGRRILYGIERYYVPEGKGKDVPGDLSAEIAIQPGGKAQLKSLYTEGKPWPR